MRYTTLILSLLALIACSESGKESNKNRADSTQVSIDTVFSSACFDLKDFKKLELPLKIDSTYILQVDTSDKVHYYQIRNLKSHFPDTLFKTGLHSMINEFCEIDSLKENGAFEEYLKKIDIGMTKSSIAFKIGYLTLPTGTNVFLWGIEYSSYEACPYFSGKILVATYVNESGKNSSFLIAESSGAGDPPATGKTDLWCTITKEGSFQMNGINVSDDIDVPGVETETRTTRIDLSKNTFSMDEIKTLVVDDEDATP